MQASLYDRDTVIIRPGHPGRFMFSRTIPGYVILQHLSPNKRRFGLIRVPADTYERDYAPAIDPYKRASLRGKVLKAIHTGNPPPDDITAAQRTAAIKWLRSQQLIEPGPDGTHRSTAEGAKYVKDQKADE